VLVVKNRWPAQDAAREIAMYKAKVAQTLDSLRAARDSIFRQQQRAEQARRDSIYRLKDRLDGPDARTYPDSGAWMADDRTGAYYRTSCDAARRIPVDHRVYFTTEEDAKAADLWRSGQPGCRFADWKQQAVAESLSDDATYGERDRRLRADSLHAAFFPVWGSNESKSYFSSSPACAPAVILPAWDRVLFRTAAEAEEAGFTAYDSDTRCTVRP